MILKKINTNIYSIKKFYNFYCLSETVACFFNIALKSLKYTVIWSSFIKSSSSKCFSQIQSNVLREFIKSFNIISLHFHEFFHHLEYQMRTIFEDFLSETYNSQVLHIAIPWLFKKKLFFKYSYILHETKYNIL